MSVLNLERLLKPKSVALIGASDKEGSLGRLVMRNLLEGGFQGPIWPVNPKYRTVHDRDAYPDIASLPATPDLAAICTPAPTLPGLIAELGEHGVKAAVVLSAGTNVEDEEGKTIEQRMLEAARPHGVRILGPNCIGLLLPNIGLNASFAHTYSLPGRLALISQSGALCTTLIDWTKSRGIGFSHFISLGNSADVDFGDLLNYLSGDSKTSGILLYVESIKEARKFMSAARATARNKPVIVIKAGRVKEGARAAASHTGALAGSDDIFDSAIRRAGMLRVYSIEDLFAAAETLARARPIAGNRLVILTNGGGPGVLATDALVSRGGRLAELAEETVEALNACLPPTWSKDNPVDIIGDGGAERYANALGALIPDPHYDAILVMLVPSAVVDNEEVARTVTEQIRHIRKPVLTCWMGEEAVHKARKHFENEGVPSYETPDAAVNAFLQMYEYQDNQNTLFETPPSVPEEFRWNYDDAAAVITTALEDEREILSEAEAKQVLQAYGVPVVETRVVKDVDEAVATAEAVGFPVALKILSHDISHKSDVGGVLLDIESAEILRYSAEGMLSRIERMQPGARVEGFTVQKMIHWPGAYELIVGAVTDPIFGPAILFGRGGSSVEVINDKAVALPPLNMALARQLIARTDIYRILRGYRDKSAVDLEAICLTLMKVAQIVIDHPQVVELDINPLFSHPRGVLALDARIRVAATGAKGAERLAIQPYPKNEEESITLNDGQEILLRPIKPEDEPAHHDFLGRLTAQDRYYRFFRAVTSMSHTSLARFTQIDYDREMAFIAVGTNDEGQRETLGVARAVSDADNVEAEFAIIVRSDRHGRGLGQALMSKLINYCRRRGTRRLVGQTLRENDSMRRLAERFGFQATPSEDGTIDLQLDLRTSGQ